MRKLRVGLALGGGAARGAAHIGILKVLESENIPIHIITGTSIGAIIGAMYSTHPNALEIEKRAREYIESKRFKRTRLGFLDEKKFAEKGSGFFYKFTHHVKKNFFYNLSLAKKSLISQKEFLGHIEALIDDIDIRETRLRFAAIAADLNSGNEVVFKTGPIRRAVSASCAIPGILPPVKLDEYELVDGGSIDLIPVGLASDMGANLVIGVDVSKGIDTPFELSCAIDVVIRYEKITAYTLNQIRTQGADLVLRPDVQDVFWADFSKFDHCIQKGEEEVNRNLHKIKKLLLKKRLTHWF
jgi:NTE family protein